MKLVIESSVGRVELSTSRDLTRSQVIKAQDALLDLVLQPVELEGRESILNVPFSVAQYLINRLRSGDPNPESESGLAFGQNKIYDIKFVRRVANAGLREAKEFVDKYGPMSSSLSLEGNHVSSC